ncbi:MAG TPA: protein kinase [Streptosporangiaceae bacterium]|nr:protein kinase [Streptosporangiaceae bacterium]
MSEQDRPRPDLPADLPAGAEVAGYRVEEQIGHGGMAVIYRARDARLERDVALKILAPRYARDDAFQRRFIRESRAAAAVDHPHIIPIFAAGESGGVLFIAMRYVPGGDVRTLMAEEGLLAPARADRILTQVASALDAAHQHGLVHRDIKPSNMLLDLTAGRDELHVYLADFGLSKRVLSVTGITAAGQFLGTPSYMAPEQIQGGTVDGRADQYALACTVFEMLAGAPPFDRDDDMAIVWAHLSDPPPPVSARRPDLPAAVDAVLARALAKAPEDRFPSCLAFAGALRDALGLGRVPARPASPPTRQEAAVPVGPVTETMAQLSGDQLGLPPAATMPEPSVRRGPARSRPWWRSPSALIVAACLVAGGAAGGVLAALGGGGSGGPEKTSDAANGVAAPAAPTVPNCSTAVAKAKNLTGVKSTLTTTGGQPFGVVTTSDGDFSFAALGDSVAVLSNSGSAQAPRVLHTFTVSGAQKGLALTHDGLLLLAATSSGAAVINVAAAEQGNPNPVVGTLTSSFGEQAVEVAISADDKFAFVTLQAGAGMVVFDLHKALATQSFGSSDVVGRVPLGQQPVGMAMSPDGKSLYVTSMTRQVFANLDTATGPGTLSLVDVAKAETDPTHAVLATTAAGCNPVRVVLSANGRQLWVTSRESDALLGFSAAALRAKAAHPLNARVAVGAAPIGLALIKNGSQLLVANTSLHAAQPGTGASVAVISTSAALSNSGHALIGTFTTGLGREFALSPDGRTILMPDNTNGRVRAIDVTTLP